MSARRLDERAEHQRKKAQRKADLEKRVKAEYARQVEHESARALEAQRLIREMAAHEERLMASLRETQNAQTKAYEDLQATLKL